MTWVGPHVGESVGPTTQILTLADLAHLRLQAGVDESALASIHIGETVSIAPEAFKGKTVAGKVTRVGWLATTTSGVINVPVTIDVDQTDVPLRPGLSASALFKFRVNSTLNACILELAVGRISHIAVKCLLALILRREYLVSATSCIRMMRWRRCA